MIVHRRVIQPREPIAVIPRQRALIAIRFFAKTRPRRSHRVFLFGVDRFSHLDVENLSHLERDQVPAPRML